MISFPCETRLCFGVIHIHPRVFLKRDSFSPLIPDVFLCKLLFYRKIFSNLDKNILVRYQESPPPSESLFEYLCPSNPDDILYAGAIFWTSVMLLSMLYELNAARYLKATLITPSRCQVLGERLGLTPSWCQVPRNALGLRYVVPSTQKFLGLMPCGAKRS